VCGDVVVEGVNDDVKLAIVEGLTGEETKEGSDSLGKGRIWRVGEGAPFAAERVVYLKNSVKVLLSEQGYFFPWVDVEIVRDDESSTAKLSVKVKDAGPRGIVEGITVSGNKKNSREDILDYLGLKEGMQFNREMVERTQELLWESGRFLSFAIKPQPVYSKDAKLKLRIEVSEYENAPALSEDLSRVQESLLGLGRYVAGWQEGGDDIVATIDKREWPIDVLGDVQVILSPKKGILVVARKDVESGNGIIGALLFGADEKAYYSGRGGRKFSFLEFAHTVILEFTLNYTPSVGSDKDSMVKLGFGFAADEDESPLRFNLSVSPCYLMREAYRYESASGDEGDEYRYSYEGDVLNCRNDDFEMKVDTKTGRPLQVRIGSGSVAGDIVIRTEAGAFDEALGAIRKTSDEWVNEFDSDRPVSSFLSFMWERVVEQKIETVDDEGDVEKAKIAADRFGTVLEKVVPASLDKVFAGSGDSDEDSFRIPTAMSAGEDMTAKTMEWLSAVAFRVSNDVFARDSWPWTLSRETVFILGGKGMYSGLVLERLYGSGEMGPLGYLTTARVMGRISPQMGTAFAVRGLEKLSVEDFRKDIDAFLKGDAVLGRCLIEAGEALRELSDAEVDVLISVFPDERQGPVRRSLEILRKDKSRPVREVLPAACDELWREFLREKVKAILQKMASRASAMNI
jgi:hypothetical protein